MRKFDNRCSPPVRMTKVGSGSPAVWKTWEIARSSIASVRMPLAARRRNASTSSVRPA